MSNGGPVRKGEVNYTERKTVFVSAVKPLGMTRITGVVRVKNEIEGN